MCAPFSRHSCDFSVNCQLDRLDDSRNREATLDCLWTAAHSSRNFSINRHQVLTSIIMFVVIYFLLLSLFLFLLDRKIKQGPDEYEIERYRSQL